MCHPCLWRPVGSCLLSIGGIPAVAGIPALTSDPVVAGVPASVFAFLVPAVSAVAGVPAVAAALQFLVFLFYSTLNYRNIL